MTQSQLKRPEIYNHIKRLIQNGEKKLDIRLIIKKRYKLSPKQSYWYIREYEKQQRAIGNKNPFLEVTDEEIISYYLKSSGAHATARALMVTMYRVETLIEKEIQKGNEDLLKKRNSLNKATVTSREARPSAMTFLKQFKGHEMTRNQLLDIACKDESCNRFTIQEIKKMAEQAGIIIKKPNKK